MAVQTADQNQQLDPKQVINSLLQNYKLSLQAANRSPKTISWYFDILEKQGIDDLFRIGLLILGCGLSGHSFTPIP